MTNRRPWRALRTVTADSSSLSAWLLDGKKVTIDVAKPGVLAELSNASRGPSGRLTSPGSLS